nr:GTPase RhebL1 [Pelodiscus sinensis]|eukprot:XP_014433033.2 GTPase RhebL1 [Pelodiscus sinensis]
MCLEQDSHETKLKRDRITKSSTGLKTDKTEQIFLAGAGQLQGSDCRVRCACRIHSNTVSNLFPPGKTSLAHQFIDGEFLECYDPTVESTYNKMLMVGKDEFHLQLVDTAGQDEYTILPHSFSIGIHGYVLVYSVTSLRSFQVVKTLHNRLYESRGKTRMPVVLVGNKADLSMESREVNTDEGKKLADSWGAIFLESSAKENQMTRGIFTKIIEEIDRVDNSYGAERSCCLM